MKGCQSNDDSCAVREQRSTLLPDATGLSKHDCRKIANDNHHRITPVYRRLADQSLIETLLSGMDNTNKNVNKSSTSSIEYLLSPARDQLRVI